MEKSQGKRTDPEIERLRHELGEATTLIRKMGKIIQSRDQEIHKLREIIAQREKRRVLPAMPEGSA